jgi:hypothetical protein
MDQVVQKKLKEATEEYGAENLVVILGTPDTESADIYAETVIAGDPTYAGPLAGVPLGLSVYHIFEDEIKDAIPADVYEEEIGLMELSLDSDGIRNAMKEAREKYKCR